MYDVTIMCFALLCPRGWLNVNFFFFLNACLDFILCVVYEGVGPAALRFLNKLAVRCFVSCNLYGRFVNLSLKIQLWYKQRTGLAEPIKLKLLNYSIANLHRNFFLMISGEKGTILNTGTEFFFFFANKRHKNAWILAPLHLFLFLSKQGTQNAMKIGTEWDLAVGL